MSFPDSYWDKFVKKKVRNKYSDQFDYDELTRFLGMEKNDTSGKFEIVKPIETGLWAKIKSIDMRYQVWKWGVIFTDNSFLYVFFYFLFSVVGNFAFFVYAIHLLDVAISIKSLSTILKSITHNGRQLMLTIMLMTVVVYLYTVVAFNFFRKFYTKEEDEEREENCKDMFTTFLMRSKKLIAIDETECLSPSQSPENSFLQPSSTKLTITKTYSNKGKFMLIVNGYNLQF
ncbi:unnamed protein product [Rotaria magnacalcarata]|uniref:Ion transport domain-containing protein n=1 Tax=Rotaria magnacalcarata TaxID=392030 RepID=A0A8S3BU41_9BILA|nr:unnamed protein product [Rotaria magnacalcarata]